jgi:hypothetical protein
MQAVQAGLSSATLASRELARATVMPSRESLLLRSLECATTNGMLLELGVYKGYTLRLIASARPGDLVYGFDSFDGLPETWRHGFEKGTFSVATDSLQPFQSNVKLRAGLFETSLPALLNDDSREVAFLHVDCDLYSYTKNALTILISRIKSGTVIVFDEYFNFPGWEFHEYKAWQEISSEFGIAFEYLFYNPKGQQVSIIVTSVR